MADDERLQQQKDEMIKRGTTIKTLLTHAQEKGVLSFPLRVVQTAEAVAMGKLAEEIATLKTPGG